MQDKNGSCENKIIKQNWENIVPSYSKTCNIEIPSIAIAEASAIYDALTWVSNHLQNLESDIVLFCDNKYVVNATNNNTRVKNKHKTLAIKIQQKLFQIRQHVECNITWMPAHCDIKSHDQADILAVQGAEAAL